MMVDTDVLIWYFRGNQKARKIIHELTDISISAVVYMELLQGMRNKNELRYFKRFILDKEISCVNLSGEITSRSIYFLEEYTLSHGLRMPDALIAATADIHAEDLLTANDMHYKMIPGVSLKKFRP